MRNTALLVVDMQHGFLDPGEALETPPAREIVPAIQIQRATLDIIGRAYGRVVSSKHIADEVSAW